jgi:hypothetical protein
MAQRFVNVPILVSYTLVQESYDGMCEKRSPDDRKGEARPAKYATLPSKLLAEHDSERRSLVENLETPVTPVATAVMRAYLGSSWFRQDVLAAAFSLAIACGRCAWIRERQFVASFCF